MSQVVEANNGRRLRLVAVVRHGVVAAYAVVATTMMMSPAMRGNVLLEVSNDVRVVLCTMLHVTDITQPAVRRD